MLGGNGAASQPEVIDDHEVVEMELEDTFTFTVAHPAKPNIFSNAVFCAIHAFGTSSRWF